MAKLGRAELQHLEEQEQVLLQNINAVNQRLSAAMNRCGQHVAVNIQLATYTQF